MNSTDKLYSKIMQDTQITIKVRRWNDKMGTIRFSQSVGDAILYKLTNDGHRVRRMKNACLHSAELAGRYLS